MPKLDGMEVLKKLRETNDVPVIFLTSKDDELTKQLDLEWELMIILQAFSKSF